MKKKKKIQELMNAKKPVTLGLIAKELGCTDLEAAQALPSEICSFIKDISSFDVLWAQMSQWEKVTLFIIHEGHVFEIQSKLSAGKRGMGYYNILSKDAVIGGHLNADSLETIAFISMPFMGRESHYVAFFGKDKKLHFSVYVGRENHQLIESVKEGFMKAKAQFC